MNLEIEALFNRIMMELNQHDWLEYHHEHTVKSVDGTDLYRFNFTLTKTKILKTTRTLK